MLPLSALIEAISSVRVVAGDVRVRITGLGSDSRGMQPGFLFTALHGTVQNGEAYIAQAIEKGAVAVLLRKGAVVEIPPGIARIEAENPRRALALCAARFYASQPGTIAAITGTDGKTSTAEFIRQLWEGVGQKSASIGTLGMRCNHPAERIDFPHTTPEPVALHRQLQALAASGVQHVALEASSHGLDQHRLDGVVLRSALFTTFGSDHGDYHSSPEEYFSAKARLFCELLPEGGTAILNADDARIAALQQDCEERGHRVLTFGKKGRDLTLVSAQPCPEGLQAELCVMGEVWQGVVPLYGGFQLMNVLAACGAVLADADCAEVLFSQMHTLTGVPGRLEKIVERAEGGAVFVDYAHTKQALENALLALRPHTKGKLHVVFGCGGDRDRAKRSEMGTIAAGLADVVVVTDDNPRSEDPAVIRAEILCACPDAREVADRSEAIAAAMQAMVEGDVLLVAGKGHETTQVIGDAVRHHSDAEVILGLAGGSSSPLRGERTIQGP